jgi:hypothetical protein
MPSTTSAAGTSVQQKNPEFIRPASLDMPLPSGIPLFGRAMEGAMTLAASYNINTRRNGSAFYGTGWIGGAQILSIATSSGAFSASVGIMAPGLAQSSLATAVGGDTSNQACSTSSGSALVTGLSSTATMVVGQIVSVANYPTPRQVITAVNNATSITLDQNATASGTSSLQNYQWVQMDHAPAAYFSQTPAQTWATDSLLTKRSVDSAVMAVSAIDGTNSILTLTTIAGKGSGSDLAAGDLCVIINCRGDGTYSSNVGNFELVSIASATATSVNGTIITLTAALTKIYGQAASNAVLGSQRIQLARLPEYADVIINSGGILTASSWDGSGGGIVGALAQSMTVNGTGRVDASGLGYRGAASAGFNGEGTKGGLVSSSSNAGSGGPGGGVGSAGPAGSSAAAATSFINNNSIAYGGAAGGGGGGGGGGPGGGGGYSIGQSFGTGGGGGGGGAAGYQNSHGATPSGGADTSGSTSNGGLSSSGFATTSTNVAGAYYAGSAGGGAGGASAFQAVGSDQNIGQAILSSILFGGGGGGAGIGAIGGAGGRGGDMTGTSNLTNTTGGAGGAGGGNGGGLAVSGSVATAGGAGTAISGPGLTAGTSGTVGLAAGSVSGIGGAGGGIVLILAKTLTNPLIKTLGVAGQVGGAGGSGGTIPSAGAPPAPFGGGAGGSGGGGGGGGGGAGGTIYLFAWALNSVNPVASSAFIFTGAAGGAGGNPGALASGLNTPGYGATGCPGGSGDFGRIKAEFSSQDGSFGTRAGPGVILGSTLGYVVVL